MSNTEKLFDDFTCMLAAENKINLTLAQRKQIVKNCFENDTIFDTLYEQVWDEIENVIGKVEG